MDRKSDGQGKKVTDNPGMATRTADLASSYHSLQKYLSELEQENKKLSVEMDRKRKARLERLKGPDAITFKALREKLRRAEYRTERHEKALQFLRAFLRKNRRALRSMAENLKAVNQELKQNPDSAASARQKLTHMLAELKSLQNDRQRILNRIG
ncbi:MAG: hypothetical protein HS115_02060 [Spirochaetales bacterium]|nr:hypothetical protein [Spirochaetales bacterium]